MSRVLCQHASMRKGKIYLTIKQSDDDCPYENIVYDKDLATLRSMVLDGQLVFTRKPITKLELSLSRLKEHYEIAEKLKLLAVGLEDASSKKVLLDAINLIQEDSEKI